MLALSTLVLLLTVRWSLCSVVMEASSQKSIYVSDYCPKMKYCAEGTHVMCMYYDPNRIMGPRCTKPKNVSVTPYLAEKLLEISNAIRSKIALGKEKGKGGELFPKGYGMFRLKWDSELATFAQVLANQCMLRHDMCRATKRFPDPGQTAGLVRFTYPEWIPLAKNTGLDKPGLTKHKLEYAVKQALKSWYGQKSVVDSHMVMASPDWTANPGNQYGRLYLEMIYGPATHMGCGMSAYTEYAYYDNNAPLNYNAIQIICNYSSRSRKGGPVYEVAPPTMVGFTIKCGCPAGMDEDADCLCYESTRTAITSRPIGRDTCSGKDHSCKPAVVLLPIFTVENAPPEKLALRSTLDDKKESEMEIMDFYQPSDNNSMYHGTPPLRSNLRHVMSNIIGDAQPNILNSFPANSIVPAIMNKPTLDSIYNNQIFPQPLMQGKEPHSIITNLINEVHHKVGYPQSTTPKSHIYDMQYRVQDNRKQPSYFNTQNTLYSPLSHGYSQVKKASVFSKVPTFELSKKAENPVKPNRDVMPRKDFSKIKSLVKSYLDLRRHKLESKKDDPKSSVDFLKFLRDHNKSTTEPYLQLQSSAEEKLITYNSLFKDNLESKGNKPFKSIFSDTESDSSKERSNDKLMNLLDKLEQEVKHIELDKNKKEIFDAKIRKIYGTVVGKTEFALHKTNKESDLTDMEQSDNEKYKTEHNGEPDLENNHEKHIHSHPNDGFEADKTYETEKNREHVKRENTQNDMRPITRNQNDIVDHVEKHSKDHRDYDIDAKRPYNDKEDINSNYPHSGFRDTEEAKSRMYNDKEVLRVKHKQLYSEAEEKKKLKDLEKRKHAVLSDNEDDPLGIDRRRFYQEKLDKIVRKVHNTRKYKHHAEPITNPVLRPIIRPSRDEAPLRPGKSQANPFYMPDRARFLHGF